MLSENLSPLSPQELTQISEDQVKYYMKLHEELDKLEELVIDTGIHFMGKAILDEEKLCQQIDQVRLAIPESIAKAEEILQYREQIISESERYAQRTIEMAQQRAERLVEESVIVRQAEAAAQELRRQTERECEEMRNQVINEVNQMRKQAQKEWETLRQRVAEEVEEMQRGADAYSDQILSNLEAQLLEMLRVVQNGRKELR